MICWLLVISARLMLSWISLVLVELLSFVFIGGVISVVRRLMVGRFVLGRPTSFVGAFLRNRLRNMFEKQLLGLLLRFFWVGWKSEECVELTESEREHEKGPKRWEKTLLSQDFSLIE